ncbi:hydrogenase expression/formation protein [Thiorhodococcus mannitoliphagus]|uniref:Hydrogenase expression/formation protein n=1 Tax=Thiorhodococcus mannitoliphagus TaxID=329406 RepID=A0A6P1DTA2_9GAMM|nr:hydrogenase expression/formation protein [Thiorhodococcus mannitoliphagus]NEX20433.1 hydrogenase expression/formation protein [Thiorhodococcus mannitoliphagus]
MSAHPATPNGCQGTPRSFGNALPVLNEIRHALEKLVTTGEETRIDLSALPFGPGDLDRLTDWLGTGEVEATVDALGPTRVQETAIPGVWLVDYHNSEQQRLTLHIEVAPVPEILRPQPQDLADALNQLDARLEQETGTTPLSS